MHLGSCFTFPLQDDNRLWLMQRSRGPWRLRVPYRKRGFDPDVPLYETGGLSLREALAVAYEYRQPIMLCADICRPSSYENPKRYHREPHATAAEARPFFREAFQFFKDQGAEVIAVEVGNEADVWMHVDTRRYGWDKLEPLYQEYQRVYVDVHLLMLAFFSATTPLIVGGTNPLTFRNRTSPGAPPSLALWMSEQGAEDVAWHASDNWTPERIEAATRALRRAHGSRVWITEDVYKFAPRVDLRGEHADVGGAECYNIWAAHIFDKWQPHGDGIGLENDDGSLNESRAEEIDRLSRRLGLQDLSLEPREGRPVGPPVPPPEPPVGPEEPESQYAELTQAGYDLLERSLFHGSGKPITPWKNLSFETQEKLILKQAAVERARKNS